MADDQIKSIYSPAFLTEVAEEFKIPGELFERFSDVVLQAGAAVYKRLKMTAYARPTLTEVQKYFDMMEHHASALSDLLDSIDDA